MQLHSLQTLNLIFVINQLALPLAVKTSFLADLITGFIYWKDKKETTDFVIAKSHYLQTEGKLRRREGVDVSL